MDGSRVLLGVKETRLTLRKEKKQGGAWVSCRLVFDLGKEGKRGGAWAPCRLVFDAPGKSGNEAACELHTASSSTPQKGGETTRQRASFTRHRWVLDSSVVLLAPAPRCSPPRSPSNYRLLS